MQKLVSVIITTKNEQAVLERLLKSINKQSYKNIETIVVDNNSEDKTKEIAKKYTSKVYNFGPERSAQRNFGAKKSKGGMVFFVDADMELTRNVVADAVVAIDGDKNNAAVIVPERAIGFRFWEKVKAFERNIYNLEGDETTDAARFFIKKIFWEMGGYDEKITGPEDWDLPENIKKAGYKIVRIKSLINHYENINHIWDLARKKYYYGLKSHVYINKNKISPFSAKTIYILRPIYYRNWRLLLRQPLMSISMFVMLMVEQISGGLGFLIGKL